jgi:hypothetical protein
MDTTYFISPNLFLTIWFLTCINNYIFIHNSLNLAVSGSFDFLTVPAGCFPSQPFILFWFFGDSNAWKTEQTQFF